MKFCYTTICMISFLSISSLQHASDSFVAPLSHHILTQEIENLTTKLEKINRELEYLERIIVLKKNVSTLTKQILIHQEVNKKKEESVYQIKNNIGTLLKKIMPTLYCTQKENIEVLHKLTNALLLKDEPMSIEKVIVTQHNKDCIFFTMNYI